MSVRPQKSSKSMFIELLFVESVQFRTGIKRVKVKVRVWIRARDRVETVTLLPNITTSLLHGVQKNDLPHLTGQK